MEVVVVFTFMDERGEERGGKVRCTQIYGVLAFDLCGKRRPPVVEKGFQAPS